MKNHKSGNKKKGRKKILAAAVCIGLLTAAGGIFLWQKSNAQASSGAAIIEAGENEEIIYARIDNIVGNDIDVSIVMENVSESGNMEGGGFGQGNAASVMPGDTQSDFPEIGNRGVNGGISGSGNRGRNTAGIAAAYTETGESKSFEIPVGTQVITKLGVETTFSRLSAENIIAVLLEEGTDNILKIWVIS